MRYYETLYIVNPNLADEDYKEVVAKFSGLVEKNEGVVTKADEWGKKSLAYTVKKHDKGYYVLLQYCGEPGITDRLKRDLKLDDRVLKYQTIKLSDHVDPEAIKAEARREVAKTDETPTTSEEINPKEEEMTEKDQEGENAISES
ncbi:MAG: 30S ribosomal protein S6 [Desulfobacteraceae bacterium]|nr:30S ribosomal protein S6 [Desulfobacteraceae bacterium]